MARITSKKCIICKKKFKPHPSWSYKPICPKHNYKEVEKTTIIPLLLNKKGGIIKYIMKKKRLTPEEIAVRKRISSKGGKNSQKVQRETMGEKAYIAMKREHALNGLKIRWHKTN